MCVVAPPRFPVPFDKGYVGFSWPPCGFFLAFAWYLEQALSSKIIWFSCIVI